MRTAARLNALHEGKIFAGDAERPADERKGAATSTYTLAAAGEPAVLGGEEGTVARQFEFKIAGLIEARTAETAKDPTPTLTVSAGPLGW